MTGEAVTEPRPSFVGSVNWVFLTIIGSYLLGFLANIIVTQALTAEARGLYAIFLTAATLVATVLTFGYQAACTYLLGRGEVDVRTALSHGLFITLIAGASAACVSLLFPLLSDDNPLFGAWFHVLFIVGVIALVVVTILNGMFVGEGRFAALNLLRMLRPASQFGLFLAAIGLGTLSLALAIALWLGSLLMSVGAGLLLIGPARSGLFHPGWPQWRLLRRMLGFGLTSQAGNMAQLLNYRLDSFLVLAFVGQAGVAYYAIATAVAEALWFLPTAVSTVLLPRLIRAQGGEAAWFTPLISRLTLALTTVSAVAVVAVAPFAVPLLFGASYSHAVPPLYALFPGVVAASVTKVLASYVFSQGRVAMNTGVALLALVVTVVLDLLLIPLFGIIGAAFASSASYSTSLLLTLWLYRRLSGRPAWETLVPQPKDLVEIALWLKQVGRSGPIFRRTP